jgi:hypothetical protein
VWWSTIPSRRGRKAADCFLVARQQQYLVRACAAINSDVMLVLPFR